MEAPETLEQYYAFTCRRLPSELRRSDGLSRHFNVFVRAECFKPMPFRRREYYKINLCKGKAVLFTEKGEVEINEPALFFSSPMHQFGWRNISGDQQGYVCLFNELYLNPALKQGLKKLNRLFRDDIYPFVPLTEEQYALFCQYFRNMSDEYHGSFAYKDEIIQNMLQLIIYTAMKLRLSDHPDHSAGKHLLVSRFLDMLDAQFPVDSPLHAISLKTPAGFADQLHVHVNHLNHIIKKYTGKTTSRLIAEKRIAEAVALLKNTDWTIAEIGFSLGFDYPQHFNVFFRKLTGESPKIYRKAFSDDI